MSHAKQFLNFQNTFESTFSVWLPNFNDKKFRESKALKEMIELAATSGKVVTSLDNGKTKKVKFSPKHPVDCDQDSNCKRYINLKVGFY